MPKESKAVHWSYQLVRDKQTDYITPLPANEGSKHGLVCVGIASGLTQAFPCCYTNQVKAHVMQDEAKEHDTEWKCHLPCHPQAIGLIKRKTGILKQQIDFLISKATLFG